MRPKMRFRPYPELTPILPGPGKARVTPAGPKTFASPKAYGVDSCWRISRPRPPNDRVDEVGKPSPKPVATGGRINPAGVTLAKAVGR